MTIKNAHFNKILILNPFGIGDCLFTIPLIRNLKCHFPESFIGFLSNARTSDFLARYPYINRVFEYERDEFNQVYHKSKLAFLRKGYAFLKQIKQCNFDLAIDLSLNGSMSFLMCLIGIPQRKIGRAHV